MDQSAARGNRAAIRVSRRGRNVERNREEQPARRIPIALVESAGIEVESSTWARGHNVLGSINPNKWSFSETMSFPVMVSIRIYPVMDVMIHHLSSLDGLHESPLILGQRGSVLRSAQI